MIGAATRSNRFMQELRELGAQTTGELAEFVPAGSAGTSSTPTRGRAIEPDVTIGGIVAACRQLKTRKGEAMAVFTVEDAQGGVEVIAFPERAPARG